MRKALATWLISAAIFAGAPRSAAFGLEGEAALRVREFVVMGYLGVQSDVERGEGPYLESLAQLLGRPDGGRDELVRELRGLLTSRPNIMDFADAVAALPAVVSPAAAAPVPVPSGPGVVSGDAVENALAHLTRGQSVTVHLRNGDRLTGRFVDYQSRRLWLRGAARKSVPLRDILAVDSGS